MDQQNDGYDRYRAIAKHHADIEEKVKYGGMTPAQREQAIGWEHYLERRANRAERKRLRDQERDVRINARRKK